MSYCRFGCDGGKSDFYCYLGDKGYVTHLVARDDPDQWPDVFVDETLEQFKTRLLDFRERDYHVPQHALDRIEEELISIPQGK